jgi:NAD(P)-binding Rossmann-like domain
MQHIETDYLIIGSGAAGLAFADTLIDESSAHITIVDRHGKPGGHWNDAYSFVTLHQPSAFYGVNSLALGANRKDTVGANKGLYELASGAEVSGYFDRVMNQKLLPSGRVSYHPMCNYVGDGSQSHRFVSILSGAETQVTVRKKVVDATYYSPSVPSTHSPKYKVAAGVRLVTPNVLAHLWQGKQERPKHFMIIGAGKTAMDVGVWLLNAGAQADDISWVMPRDSWLVNRLQTQPGAEFFNDAIGGQANQMEAFAKATSIDDLFDRLEACDAMLRIDRTRKPSMFHFATISKGEVELLKTIKNVIRMGHVQSIEAGEMVLDQGRVALPEGTLCIDCTASAVEQRPIAPIFQGNKLLLQLVRVPLPTFSAALIAYVEAHYEDDEGDVTKNRLCGTVPFPDSLDSYPRSIMANMMNQFHWSQDKVLRNWIRDSRLDGFGKLIASADPADEAKQAILLKLKECAMAAMANIPKLRSGRVAAQNQG